MSSPVDHRMLVDTTLGELGIDFLRYVGPGDNTFSHIYRCGDTRLTYRLGTAGAHFEMRAEHWGDGSGFDAQNAPIALELTSWQDYFEEWSRIDTTVPAAARTTLAFLMRYGLKDMCLSLPSVSRDEAWRRIRAFWRWQSDQPGPPRLAGQ